MIKCLGWGPKRPDWMRVSMGSLSHVDPSLIQGLPSFRIRKMLTLTRRASRLSCRKLASSAANRVTILYKHRLCKYQSNGALLNGPRHPQREPAKTPLLVSTASGSPPSNLHSPILSRHHFRRTTMTTSYLQCRVSIVENSSSS